MHSARDRNQAGTSWVTKAVVYTAATALAAALAGACLGGLGSLLPASVRVALGSLLGLAAVVVGGAELIGRPLGLIHRDCETPQRWVHAGAVRWAAVNGAALGVGATSRIGFWLWYAVPLGAVLAGDPALGAALYASYGLVRGGSVWALLLLPRRLGMRGDQLGIWLIQRDRLAHTLTAAQLVLLGVVVVLVVGF